METNYTKEQLEQMVASKNWKERAEAARQGFGLERLVEDPDWYVRWAVAEKGYVEDVLVNDPHWAVREAVARQGYGLDVLVNDESVSVRVAVAEQGYGLDKLVDDPKSRVRRAVFKYIEENWGLSGEEALEFIEEMKAAGNKEQAVVDEVLCNAEQRSCAALGERIQEKGAFVR